jgi:hypothetical protein
VRADLTPKLVAVLALAGVFLLAFGERSGAPALAAGAQQGGAQPAPTPKPEPTAPTTTQGEGAKPETGKAQPEKSAFSPATGGTAETPQPESGPASLGELTKDGFEFRTTDFIPAEAVTRQSGKVSSDAIVVTLQKTTATAVCFYTLKAYVSKKLTTIPACTVHR